MTFNRTLATLATASLTCLAVPSFAEAAISFSIGQVSDLGAQNYTFPLLVRSDDALSVRGAEVIQVIGDGGVAAGGTTTSPSFVAMDLKPVGGLFASTVEPPTPVAAFPQFQDQSITLLVSSPVTVPTTSTLLATITFNAAGLSGRTFPLHNFFDSASSNFSPAAGGDSIAVTNQSIIVTIPEPTTLAALAGLTTLTLRRRRIA